MKKIFCISLVCIILGIILIIPVSAEGGFTNYLVTVHKQDYFNYDIDCYLIYCDSSVESCYFAYQSDLTQIKVYPASQARVCTFRFVNNYNYPVSISFVNTNSMSYSNSLIVIPAGDYRDVTSNLSDPNSRSYGLIIGNVKLDVDYNYSVFDVTGIISNIGNMFGFVSGSTVLLPLFLVGVAISLGLVAVRFVRKVMWGN